MPPREWQGEGTDRRAEGSSLRKRGENKDGKWNGGSQAVTNLGDGQCNLTESHRAIANCRNVFPVEGVKCAHVSPRQSTC